jgi:hypothetical protein
VNNMPEELDDLDQDLFDELKSQYFKQTGRENIKAFQNPQLDKALKKASALCREHEIDPGVFIAAQMQYFTPRTGQKKMFPNDFCPANAVENCLNFKSIVHKGGTVKGSWEVQKRYLGMAIKNTGRTVEEILLDHNINFSAWFRCLITKEPIPSVIKRWGYEASQELQSEDLKVFFEHLKRDEGLEFDFSRIPKYW